MVRYQRIDIHIENVTNGIIRKTVELFKDMPYCTGIIVIPLNQVPAKKCNISIKDDVSFLMHPTPVNFFKSEINKVANVFPKIFKAAGNRIDIDIETDQLQRDLYVSLIFRLETGKFQLTADNKSSQFRYFHKQVSVSSANPRTPLFKIPADYNKVNGIWAIDTIKTKGGFYIQSVSPWAASLRNETHQLLLDSVNIQLLNRQQEQKYCNQNTVFFPVDFLAGQEIYAEFESVYTPKETHFIDFVFLLSNNSSLTESNKNIICR